VGSDKRGPRGSHKSTPVFEREEGDTAEKICSAGPTAIGGDVTGTRKKKSARKPPEEGGESNLRWRVRGELQLTLI